MKKSISTLALAAAFMVALFATGCQSSSQKVDKAEDKVVDAKEDLIKAEAKAAEVKLKAAEEWKIFKAEAETKIGDNDRSRFRCVRRSDGSTARTSASARRR